jgi:hypothetical protein
MSGIHRFYANCSLLLLVTLITIGCSRQREAVPTLAVTPLPTAVSHLPPTFTPPGPSERLFPTFPAVTVTQRPLPETSTPIAFNQTAVELRYVIPILGLDRRLQGSISSQIIVVDETTGQAVERNNQGGVLLQLQQILPELLLPVVPENCEGCVFVSYDLPFAPLHGEGWLRDPVMLASLENYMTVSLGPHFPPDTVVGLRRSASPFAPAHSAALTADGLLYTWLATESQPGPPVPSDPALLATLNSLVLDDFADEYGAACLGSPLESLLIRQGEQSKTIGLVCPAYTLPAPLLPLYAGLDAALAEKLAQSDDVLPQPPTDFPLTAVLDYKRLDGARLTLYADGTAVTQNPTGQIFTSTMSPTQAISLTNNLIASGAVRTGLHTFPANATSVITNTAGVVMTVTATPKPPRTVLLVRGPAGVYDGEWFNTFETPELAPLNILLDQLLNLAALPPETATPTAANTGTPTIIPSTTPTATAAATAPSP